MTRRRARLSDFSTPVTAAGLILLVVWGWKVAVIVAAAAAARMIDGVIAEAEGC